MPRHYTDGDTHRADYTFKGTFTPPDRITGSTGDVGKAVCASAGGSAGTWPEATVITSGAVLLGAILYVDVNGDHATVQVDGMMRLSYTGSDPTVGNIMSVAGSSETAGKVVFASANAAKRSALILDVDTVNKIAEFKAL